MTIAWLSPLFGRLSAEAKKVGEQWIVPKHPILETPCIIPNDWIFDDRHARKADNENVFTLSANPRGR